MYNTRVTFMAKNRKKIRHRKTINGGAGAVEGEEEGQETPQEISKKKYESRKIELIGLLSPQYRKKYETSVKAYENEYVKQNDNGEDITNYDALFHKISELHKELLDSQSVETEILALNEQKKQLPLGYDEQTKLRKILNDFFKLKEYYDGDKKQSTQILSFEKKCDSSNYNFFGLNTKCNTTVIGRIQSFLTELYKLLQENENRQPTVLTPGDFKEFFSNNGRLKKLESCKEFKNLTLKNIQSAVDFLCGKNNDNCEKLTDGDKKLVSAMKLLFPNERSINTPQGGGSRYVCRNKRKTKKKIKNKYYKYSKKHHNHHRTKRHTKRH